MGREAGDQGIPELGRAAFRAAFASARVVSPPRGLNEIVVGGEEADPAPIPPRAVVLISADRALQGRIASVCPGLRAYDVLADFLADGIVGGIERQPDVVILDGVNEFFLADENDNEPWRRLFTNTIQPLKQAGTAVLSSHNLGNDDKKNSRGSRVQVDKPDAVIVFSRTDTGCRLRCEAARTTALLRGDMHLTIRGLDGSEPITYREAAGSWPPGTRTAVDLLDRLGVPADASRATARAALLAAKHPMATEVLAAAVRVRKQKLPLDRRTV